MFLNGKPTNRAYGRKGFKMYTVYQVVLSSEDGEYVQEEFQTQAEAYNYIVVNRPHYGDGQELYINPIYRGF